MINKPDFRKRADFSLLRVVATLAVIFLHTNNTLSNNAEEFVLNRYQFVFFSCCTHLMNWTVPIFLMLTGALLLDPKKNISPELCIKKYVKRIFLALFVFGIPFSMMEIFMEARNISVKMIWYAIVSVVNGDSWGHLWYLYALIGIYLVLPILKIFVNNSDRSVQGYILIILFIFNFCTGIIDRVLVTHIAFTVPILSFPVFYVLLGKYLSDGIPEVLQNRQLNCVMLLIAAVIVTFVGMILGTKGKEILGYSSPLVAVMAVLVFSLFQRSRIADQLNSERLWRLDKLCFGIYLIHPVFINFAYKFLKLTPLSFGELYPIGVVILWIIFVILSLIATAVMNMIKPLRKYVL